MATVPRYDQPTVETNTLPMAQFNAPQAKNFAIEEGQQAMQGLQKVGTVGALVANDMQDKANQLRVDEALNQAKEESFRLSYDKDAGFLNVRGKDAVERPSGKPLADEYAENYKAHLSKISAGLGNDIQRQEFSRRSNDLATSLYGSALKHEAEQGKVLANEVGRSSINLLKADVGINFNNPAKVNLAINGGTDSQGQPIRGIKQLVQEEADRNGHSDEWVAEKTIEHVSGVHKEIVMRLMDQSPTKAQAYLNDNIAALGDHVPTLQRTLRVAVDREQGNAKGEIIFANSAPFGSTFESILPRVMKIEKGIVENDAGKGLTNDGINQTANPDLDVRNLTHEQKVKVYRERYWNAIGGDSLAPEIRAVAFDAAVNHGPSKANKMLAESGGSPEKFIELRKAEYARLIAADPEKYGKYEKSWNSRLNQLSASLKGERSKSAMVEEANQIEDPEQRNIALSRVTHLAEAERLAKKEEYDNNFIAAQEIAFKKPGGYSDIAYASWAAIKPEDREKLKAGPPKVSDPNVLLELDQKPELRKHDEIMKRRHMLSEPDFRKYYNSANGPRAEEKILQAKIDNEQFQSVLELAGMEKILTAKSGTPEWKERIDLKAKFEMAIEAEQQVKKRTLSIDEKNAILIGQTKLVKAKQVVTGSWFGWRDGPAAPEEMRVYKVKNPENIIVPEASRAAAIADYKKRGMNPTNEQILNHYLLSEQSK